MGLAVIEVEIANPAAPRKTEALEFLVDSGAIYSVVPAAVLRRLGIRPLKRVLRPLPMILATALEADHSETISLRRASATIL